MEPVEIVPRSKIRGLLQIYQRTTPQFAISNVFSNKWSLNSNRKCVHYTQGLHIVHKLVVSQHNFLYKCFSLQHSNPEGGEIQVNRQGGAVSSTIHIQPM